MNEMNPGSFSFGPLWWAIFIAIAAFAVVGVMILFLWQASKEPAPRTRAPQPAERRAVAVADRPVERELAGAAESGDVDGALDGGDLRARPLVARPAS